MALPMHGNVFAVFALINKNVISKCLMMNKLARSEFMSPVEHIHIIQGKS